MTVNAELRTMMSHSPPAFAPDKDSSSLEAPVRTRKKLQVRALFRLTWLEERTELLAGEKTEKRCLGVTRHIQIRRSILEVSYCQDEAPTISFRVVLYPTLTVRCRHHHS